MPTFEEQMSALEAVVARLELGELPLEESVVLFEEGMRLSAVCRSELEAAEGRLQVLAPARGGTMLTSDMKLPGDDEEEDDEGPL